MNQPMAKHEMRARVRLVQMVIVLALVAGGAFVMHRMYRPSVAKVCDHVAELAPNPVVQPKIDRVFAEIPEAAQQVSPTARCEAYFTAIRDDDYHSEDYTERSNCVLDARTLSSVAACLNK